MYKLPKRIASLITQVKTFGTFGEQYQIVKALKPLSCGDWLMQIKILNTDELMNYRYSQILYDPMAH